MGEPENEVPRPATVSLLRDESGIAAVEFAMIVPALLAMFICIADLGVGIYTDMQVNNAAQYGTEYAVRNGYDSTAITNAVRNATSLTGVTVNSGQFCGCPSGNSTVTTSCSASCGDGTNAGTYVQVSATTTYTTFIHYPALPASFTLVGQSSVRLQ